MEKFLETTLSFLQHINESSEADRGALRGVRPAVVVKTICFGDQARV